MSRSVSLLFVAVVASLLVGCSSPEVVPSTGKHPTLAKENVKLFQKEPKKYEIVNVMNVPITEADGWDKHGAATAGFDKLLDQAGAMGANGVLLMSDPGTYDFRVLAGYHGEWYQVPFKQDPKSVVVKAIFVHEE